MAKFNKGWNQDDSLEEVFGPVERDISGASVTRRTVAVTGAGPDKVGAVSPYGKESVADALGSCACPSTPAASSSDPDVVMPLVEGRGDLAYSKSDFTELGGRPTKTAKP